MNAAKQPHTHSRESCRRYLESLGDYIEGTLNEELCNELEAHMAICENCRIVVNTLARTIMLYRKMPSPELPNAVRERLFAVLDLKPYLDANPDSGAEIGPVE